MTLPSVTIVVLNWNGGETTRACLRSLADIAYPNVSIIVVDNASIDGSTEELARNPAIDLIRNSQNLGFTGGVNTGIRLAMERGADYVWLLNSDATTGPDVLGQLVAAAATDSRIGLVSPVFHNPEPPHTPEFVLGCFDPIALTASQTTNPAKALQWRQQHPNRIVLLGTALLIRRALIERIGVLDASFFAYVEDVDYSLRAIAAGFRNVAVPDAIVYHGFKRPIEDPQSAPPYLYYYMTRNYLLLWTKLRPHPFLSKAMIWFLRQRLLQIARMADQPAAVDALLAGIWDGLLGSGGQYNPARRMPAPLRWIVARHARFWLMLLDRRKPSLERDAA